MGEVHGTPKTITMATSEVTVTVHHNKYNNDEKFEIVWELPKCNPQTLSEQCGWKMVLIDLLKAGWSQNFILLKKKKKQQLRSTIQWGMSENFW